MKKNLLVSAILLANPVANLSATQISEVRKQAAESIKNQLIQAYNSRGPVSVDGKEYNLVLKIVTPDTDHWLFYDGTSEVPEEKVGISYELIIELHDVDTGEKVTELSTNFIRADGKFVALGEQTTVKASFKAVPCGSDDVCWFGKGDVRAEVNILDTFLTISHINQLSNDYRELKFDQDEVVFVRERISGL